LNNPNREQSDKCPKNYIKWTIVVAGMVFAFFAYLLYSNVMGLDLNLPGAEAIGKFTETIEQRTIIKTAAGEQVSPSPSVFLGVAIISVDEVIAKQLGINDEHGVLVNSVIPDSPAEKAGLQRGDVIAVINSSATKDVETFKEIMATLEPGETVKITYVRDSRKNRTYAVLAESSAITMIAQTTETTSDDSDWGVSLSAITSTLRDTYNIANNVNGVVVLSVVPGGAADQAGLVPGDVIVGIDGTSISDIDDFFDTVASDEDDTALLDIYTQGQFRYIPIASIETDDSICGTDEPIPVEQLPAYEGLFRAVPLVGVAGLGFALLGYFSLFGYPAGTKKMQAVAEKIRSGTVVFLNPLRYGGFSETGIQDNRNFPRYIFSCHLLYTLSADSYRFSGRLNLFNVPRLDWYEGRYHLKRTNLPGRQTKRSEQSYKCRLPGWLCYGDFCGICRPHRAWHILSFHAYQQ